MRFSLLILALLLSQSAVSVISYASPKHVRKSGAPAQGKNRSPTSATREETGSKVHVMQMDDDFPIEELDDENVTIDRISKRSKGGLPPLRIQHRHLREAGLAEVISWDPVDHDLFYGIVGESQWEYVIRKYGKAFPEKKLQNLRKIIKLYREEEEEEY